MIGKVNLPFFATLPIGVGPILAEGRLWPGRKQLCHATSLCQYRLVHYIKPKKGEEGEGALGFWYVYWHKDFLPPFATQNFNPN